MESAPATLVDPALETANDPVETVTEAVIETDIAEELLVEEISIDGMCGVY